jgi:hypothetical protein
MVSPDLKVGPTGEFVRHVRVIAGGLGEPGTNRVLDEVINVPIRILVVSQDPLVIPRLLYGGQPNSPQVISRPLFEILDASPEVRAPSRTFQ